VVGDSLDLVVENVALAVDGLAADLGLKAAAVVAEMDIEPRVEAVLGLGAEDQLVEPGDEQLRRIISAERDRLGRDDTNGGAIGDNIVEHSFGGRSKEVIQVGPADPEPNIRRMLERLDGTHLTPRSSERPIAVIRARPKTRVGALRAPCGKERNVVEVGQPAPDFRLSDQDGRPVTLEQLRGISVVLYFYPKDDTPGCTKEACAFRDARATYAAAGAKVIGVSPDSPASHKKFAEKYHLPFTLAADPDKTVCQSYGVWKEKNMYGKKSMGVERTTFVIDGAGIVRKVFSRVKVDGHSDQVLDALKGLAPG
jgi:thioredoxin-dependent peroxiredoxin